MLFYRDKLLSSTQLKRLCEHKYSCTNVSLLDPWFQGWWTWLVSQLPLWLAPNLITLLGLAVNILSALIVIWYSPDAKQEVPRWSCAFCALGLFIYQSLDAIDGKQARRTNSTSPLGELFDHGCDSLSTVFVAISVCITMQLGFYPSWMFFQCFCAVTIFYCSHWQNYVSGTLRFGKIDVTEAQITVIIVHVISAFFGPSIWMTKVPFVDLPLASSFCIATIIGCSMSLVQYFRIIFTGGVGKNGSSVAITPFDVSIMNIANIFFSCGCLVVFCTYCQAFKQGGIGRNGSTVALTWLWNVQLKIIAVYAVVALALGLAYSKLSVIFGGGVGKNGSTVAGTSVLSPVIPFSFVVVPAYIISRKSIQNVYENNPALYVLSFGMVTAKITNKLVVAHLTRSEMEYLDTSLLGPGMLFVNQYFNEFLDESLVLWISLVWGTFDLMRYNWQICHEICDFLKIQLFRITPSQANVPTSLSTSVLYEKNGTHGGGRHKTRGGAKRAH